MKKLFNYINYYFFLGLKWNFNIAWHIIKQEKKGEKKYGINTTGADNLSSLEKKGIDIDHAAIYMPVSYDLAEEIFTQLNGKTFHHFVDIGCGKGRAMCVAAHFGFKKVSGIDFSKELCNAAEKNLAITKVKFPEFNYRIINNDAFYFEIPDDADCIFLFNPFDEVILSGVAGNIAASYEINPRKITLIYINPLYAEELLVIGFEEIYHTKKLNYLEAVILELK